MSDLLINLSTYAYPVAFLLFFIGGVKYFSQTRNKYIALFSCGVGLNVFAQIAILISYQVYPAVFDRGAGIVPHYIRDSIISVSFWASFVGLLVASVGFLAFTFKRVGANNVT